MVRHRWVASVMVMLAAWLAPAGAQVVVREGGPPPELRAHMDAFIKAFNGADDAQWETMAKATFTAEFLKQQTADERKRAHKKMHDDFGTIAVDHVERNGGPDAPLQVFVKGSAASGVLWIGLDDASRFDSLKTEVRKAADAHRRH